MISILLSRMFNTADFMINQGVKPVIVARVLTQQLEDLLHSGILTYNVVAHIRENFLSVIHCFREDDQASIIQQMAEVLPAYFVDEKLPENLYACVQNTLNGLNDICA